MLGGRELIRKKYGEKKADAMTITLLLTSTGQKMGKTVGGAVWLDPEKTSPYDFYQYWRNVDDADVLKCIRMLTFLPIEEIESMESWEGAQLNKAKEILAYELTKLVHGEEEASKAQSAAKALFGSGDASSIPEMKLSEDDFEDDSIDIIGLIVLSGFCGSRSEARRAIEKDKCIIVDGEKITDIKSTYTKEQLSGDGVVLQKGKKNFKRMSL